MQILIGYTILLLLNLQNLGEEDKEWSWEWVAKTESDLLNFGEHVNCYRTQEEQLKKKNKYLSSVTFLTQCKWTELLFSRIPHPTVDIEIGYIGV